MQQARQATQEWIHRFPHHLLGIGGEDKRYVVPSVVAIGPYHHGLPHLQDMEEVKKVGAYSYCRYRGQPVEAVYKEILDVASEVRRCYHAMVVANLSDEDLAHMMFVDGCFLLSLMVGDQHDPLSTGCTLSSGNSFFKDIFMLENQIPWLVFEAIISIDIETTTTTAEESMAALLGFVMVMGLLLSPANIEEDKIWGCLPKRVVEEVRQEAMLADFANYSPPHILGLLRLSSLSIGAIHLVQSGVKLIGRAGSLGKFADMNCRKKLLFGELSLSPVALNDITTCWLVNMAALESAQATTPVNWDVDGYVVSSYLSMLAMLMDREEDVHVLRRSGVISSIFSDQQTLVIFKCFAQNIRMGFNYLDTLGEIDGYMRHRPVRIAIHKFVYNNYKTIAAVLSIAAALIGVMKAIYSLKRP
nr:unnamed protein product [Digitaria exilis]